MLRIFKCLLLFLCLPVYSAHLMIIDEEQYINFIVVSDQDDVIVVEPSAFHLNLGLSLNISSGEETYSVRAHDNGFISKDKLYIKESFTIGRRFPKTMIAFFYGLKKPDEYIFYIKLCINKENCLIEKGHRIVFTKKDIPSLITY